MITCESRKRKMASNRQNDNLDEDEMTYSSAMNDRMNINLSENNSRRARTRQSPPLTSAETRPTLRSSLDFNSEGNPQMTEFGRSLMSGILGHPITSPDVHWLFILSCLVLSLVSLSCSFTYLLKMVRKYPNISDYCSVILNAIILLNSSIHFSIFFTISKRGRVASNNTIVYSLLCAMLNLFFAVILINIQSTPITLAILISSVILFALLFS